MTYIVGIKLDGMTALISDTCRTTIHTDGRTAISEQGAFKSGMLFPEGGCIYAYAGSISSASEFIDNFKRHSANCSVKEDLKKWELLNEFVDRYNFPDAQKFEMILSTRHSGDPALYLLKSSERTIVPVEEDLVTLGSGKDLLDDLLLEFHEQLFDFAKKLPCEPRQALYPAPYVYCLWLMQFSFGFERKTLNHYGVGGFFHFIQQTSALENRQRPAVYVIISAIPEKKALVPIPFRVAFANPVSTISPTMRGEVLIVQKANRCGGPAEIMDAEGGLISQAATHLRGGSGHDTTVFFDQAIWSEVAMLEKHELERLAQKAVEDACEPQANFLGFGYSDKAFRRDFGMVCSTNGEAVRQEYDFYSGKMNPFHIQQMCRIVGIAPSQLATGRSGDFDRTIGRE